MSAYPQPPQQPQQPPRRRRGFTLVELAVVMAMIATLATLAYPSFADWMARKRVAAAAEMLADDLSNARLLAAQKGRTVHVSFSDGADACWSLATESNCDCRVQQTCRVQARRLADYRGVSLVSNAPTLFTPEGLGEGSAELRSARGHLLRVQVSRLGRPHLCAPVAGEPRYPVC